MTNEPAGYIAPSGVVNALDARWISMPCTNSLFTILIAVSGGMWWYGCQVQASLLSEGDSNQPEIELYSNYGWWIGLWIKAGNFSR